VSGRVRRLGFVLLFLLLTSTATAATIRGTRGADSVVGTPAADRIATGAGNDLIQVAFGGIDRVDCGAGTDVVSASPSTRT
jgi:hypothetical protein